MSQWKRVFSSPQQYRADMVREILTNFEIKAIVLNKRDSSLNNFGNYEVLVAPDDVLKAIRLIQDEIKFQ